MGSSVFHGAFSTLIIVMVVGFGKSFFFEVFFKTWTPMIIFGYLNGIILQPVLLSVMGPVNDQHNLEEEEDTHELVTIDKIENDEPSNEKYRTKKEYDNIFE